MHHACVHVVAQLSTTHSLHEPLQLPACTSPTHAAHMPRVLQDGQAITPSERIAARQALPILEQQLRAELAAEGVDVEAAAGVEDDGLEPDAEVAETGYVDEKGELRRPWCPQTRILEHREMVRSC